MAAKLRSLIPQAIGLLLFAGYLALSLDSGSGPSIPALTGVTAFAVMLLAVLLYLGDKEEMELTGRTILLFALACRLLFLFRSPVLSDDIYRFLWDGMQLLRGNNPYTLPPAQCTGFDAFSAGVLAKVNHPQYFTIYPPWAQMIFATGAALSKSLFGLKALLVALDLAACALILKLLRATGLPPWRAVLYAWHPLPIIEIGWSGHMDGAAILFLLLALSFMLPVGGTGFEGRRRKVLIGQLACGAALGISIMVKVIPLIYFPLLLAAASSPLAFAAGCVLALSLPCLPFLPHLANMGASLGVYALNWEFANAAFRTLRDLLNSGGRARIVLVSLFAATLMAVTLSFLRRRRGCDAGTGIMESLYAVTIAFLLLTPTVHPWYALYLAALLPLSGGPAGLVLSWTVFLSYHVLIRYSILGEWTENDLIARAIWLSPVIAWFFASLVKRLRKTSLKSVGRDQENC